MKKSTYFSSTIAAVFILLLFAVALSVYAREDTLSCFQYRTPIELPVFNSPQLAELPLTEKIYNSVRDDFADLRIVQNSNNGAVPVKIIKRRGRGGAAAALVSREFSVLDTEFSDLNTRYPESRIITIKTGGMPLTRFDLRADAAAHFQYMLLGQRSVHAAGAEWNFLARSGLSDQANDLIRGERVRFDFAEGCYSIYAVVVDSSSSAAGFVIDSVFGPEYCVYFQALPGRSYTLLNGYLDASPLAGFSSVALNRLMQKGGEPLVARIGPLVDNPEWRARSMGALTQDKMFLLPVVIVAVLVTALLLFAVIYSFVNRRKPVKIDHRPRFHVEK